MTTIITIVFALIVISVLYVRYRPVSSNQQPCESCGIPCQSDLAATGGSHICYNCYMVDERITELEDIVSKLTNENKEMVTCIKVLFNRFNHPDSYARTVEFHQPGYDSTKERLTNRKLVELGPEIASKQKGEWAMDSRWLGTGCKVTHLGWFHDDGTPA